MSPTFSYRLQVGVEPKWHEVIARVIGLSTDQEREAFGEKLRKYRQEYTQDDLMLNRTYSFTEFFDASSGLMTRFERINTLQQSYSDFVSEFADRGYLFGRTCPFMPEEHREKYQIEVTEKQIRNECFDGYGGRSVSNRRPLFVFPLDEILEFAISLQLRFPHDVSTRQVVRWPEKISNVLTKYGVTYDASFDYTPSLMNIEKDDPVFFAAWGRPQVATTKPMMPPYFENECACYFVDVDVFTPQLSQHMSRLAHTPLLRSTTS
jgi:hypothetical protein